ncbi:MAG TPA: condensation domain-containing protein, partial [Mycobacterium sp.]|nr:condensation domain-containing protein [Mycobacterium sp.]
YRVEISEVEAALRGRPDVHDAAVSVLRRPAGTSLVGFVVWQRNTDGNPAALRSALTDLLPSYMVPARIVALAELPVNTNGKLDGRALDRLAEDALAGADGAGSASTDTERALGEVFEEQLNGVLPHLDDDFFGLGLDSIMAISLVHKARRRGLTVTPRMLLATPTIRQLAEAIDAAADSAAAVGNAEYGAVPPLPMVSWLYEYGNYRRFTNSMLLRLPDEIDRPSIQAMLQLLLDGHDTLRSMVADGVDGQHLLTREPGVVCAADLLTRVELPLLSDAEFASQITRCARQANDQIDPRQGAMMRAVWLSGTGHGQVLLLTVHHLAVDVVSWHIILGELAEAWRSVQSGVAPTVMPELTSYRRWSQLIFKRAATPEVAAQLDYWVTQVRDPDPAVGTRHPDPARDTWSTLRVTQVVTPAETTGGVLANFSRGQAMDEFLLTVTTMTIASWRRARAQDPTSGTLITLDGHGRADSLLDADTANTVGWFTTAFPVRLGTGAGAVDVERAEDDSAAACALLDSVTAHLAAIPHDGLDYGLLHYVNRVDALQQAAEPQIMFSYLGRLDLGGVTDQPWSVHTGLLDALPIDPEPALPLRFAVYISAAIRDIGAGPQLITNWLWSDALFDAADIDRLANFWQRSTASLAAGLGRKDRHGAVAGHARR